MDKVYVLNELFGLTSTKAEKTKCKISIRLIALTSYTFYELTLILYTFRSGEEKAFGTSELFLCGIIIIFAPKMRSRFVAFVP